MFKLGVRIKYKIIIKKRRSFKNSFTSSTWWIK